MNRGERSPMGNSNDRNPDGLFPRDLVGRVVLGVCSTLFLPLMAAILFALWFRISPPQGVLEWVIRLAGTAFAGALAAYFVCGLAWAIAKPRRMEPHLVVIFRSVTWRDGRAAGGAGRIPGGRPRADAVFAAAMIRRQPIRRDRDSIAARPRLPETARSKETRIPR